MLAARLGRVRRVVGDGATALALVDPAAYYAANGDGPDEDMTYAVAQAGSGPELCACTYADWLAGSGRVLEGAMAEIAGLRSKLAALADRVTALELELVAERGEL